MSHRRAVPFLLAAAALAACGGKPQPETPAPAPEVPTAVPAVTIQSPSATPVANASADQDAVAARRATLAQPIYFGYDRAELTPEAMRTLDAKIALLREDPSLRLSISGHADERGSDEYNLALGMRRATAAKRYLAMAGLDDGRFETVSYGEERPADMGHDEAAWKQNRRAEFGVSGGEGVATR